MRVRKISLKRQVFANTRVVYIYRNATNESLFIPSPYLARRWLSGPEWQPPQTPATSPVPEPAQGTGTQGGERPPFPAWPAGEAVGWALSSELAGCTAELSAGTPVKLSPRQTKRNNIIVAGTPAVTETVGCRGQSASGRKEVFSWSLPGRTGGCWWGLAARLGAGWQMRLVP